jgi:hypothetical protein
MLFSSYLDQSLIKRVASGSGLPHTLHARYLDPSEYPTQCQTTCLPIINAVNVTFTTALLLYVYD